MGQEMQHLVYLNLVAVLFLLKCLDEKKISLIPKRQKSLVDLFEKQVH